MVKDGKVARKGYTLEQVNQLLYTHTREEVCAIIGVSITTIQKIIRCHLPQHRRQAINERRREEICRLFATGMSISEIAAHMKMHVCTIIDYMNKHKIRESVTGHAYTAETVKSFIDSGMSGTDIARALRVGHASLSNFIRDNLGGDAYERAYIEPARKRLRAGESPRQAARNIGCNPTRARQIRNDLTLNEEEGI